MINYFCKYKRDTKGPDPPMFLFDFIKYIEENLDEYLD